MMRNIANPLVQALGLAALSAAALASCAARDRAIVWTDAPELVLAVELYDAREGSRDRVELAWKPRVAEALESAEPGCGPDLVIGRRLAAARGKLADLDHLLRRGLVAKDSFYPELLEGGIVGKDRLLLPVSFNLPAIAFKKGLAAGGEFTISLAQMAGPADSFDEKPRGPFARIGFSPRWNPSFLAEYLGWGGAGFREDPASAAGLSWDKSGLAAALAELSAWSTRAGRSASAEDDYAFKYLFSPWYRWLGDGKARYAYVDSSEFFSAPEGRRAGLDIRWLSVSGRVPVCEGAVYAGLVRGASGRRAAESFLRWLLTEDAQRAVLERSRRTRAPGLAFGFSGGFSSLRAVNEEVLPALYPELVGHAPPQGGLAAPAMMPADWPQIRDAAIAPWALEAAARPAQDSPEALSSGLATALADYRKKVAAR
jgi:hypothetical protein